MDESSEAQQGKADKESARCYDALLGDEYGASCHRQRMHIIMLCMAHFHLVVI